MELKILSTENVSEQCTRCDTVPRGGRTLDYIPVIDLLLHLKYGVLVLVLGRVPCGVFPRDPEAHALAVDPHQARVPPAVHLSDQPGLQADPPRGHRHPGAEDDTHRRGSRGRRLPGVLEKFSARELKETF